MLATPAYDIALILNQGQRDTQEDAIASRVFDAANAAYVVIADGMGGHAAGEIASDLVIQAWREILDAVLDDPNLTEGTLMDAMPLAAMQANAAVSEYCEAQHPGFNMGSTMLGVLLSGTKVFWISIGDSPLYLFREGTLTQINEDHSMAPEIDALAVQGVLSQAEAQSHPDRNQLTSVIMGAEIPKVDCPEKALELVSTDVLVLGSDGLQYLGDDEIAAILRENSTALSQDIAGFLEQALIDRKDPNQDNVSIAVIKAAGQ